MVEPWCHIYIFVCWFRKGCPRERERERGAAFPSGGAMRAGERERERERERGEKRERVRKDDRNSFHTHICYRLACFLWFTLDQSFFDKLRNLQEQEGQQWAISPACPFLQPRPCHGSRLEDPSFMYACFKGSLTCQKAQEPKLFCSHTCSSTFCARNWWCGCGRLHARQRRRI